jgi:hypothetical protein
MPLAEASARTLLDREIMLTCLAEAVREDPANTATEVLARVLEVRIRAARAHRHALLQRATARAMRTGTSAAPAPRPQHAAIAGRLATARLLLQLRRVDLDTTRCCATELRSDARALRQQARQIRRHARRRQR